jgi:hypothetical protein
MEKLNEVAVRNLAADVIEELVPGKIAKHELKCSIGDKVDRMRTAFNRLLGGLAILGSLLTLGVWGLNRAAMRQDELRREVFDLRVQVGKVEAAIHAHHLAKAP